MFLRGDCSLAHLCSFSKKNTLSSRSRLQQLHSALRAATIIGSYQQARSGITVQIEKRKAAAEALFRHSKEMNIGGVWRNHPRWTIATYKPEIISEVATQFPPSVFEIFFNHRYCGAQEYLHNDFHGIDKDIGSIQNNICKDTSSLTEKCRIKMRNIVQRYTQIEERFKVLKQEMTFWRWFMWRFGLDAGSYKIRAVDGSHDCCKDPKNKSPHPSCSKIPELVVNSKKFKNLCTKELSPEVWP